MTFVSRRRHLGDAITDSLTPLDTDPSSLALAQTGFGYDTFNPTTPPVVVPTINLYPTATTPAPAARTVAQQVQGVATTASGLSNIFNSISNLFTPKPATVSPVTSGGVPGTITAAPASIGGISTSTLVVLGVLGVGIALTMRKRRA